jgi:hypothetical protein
LGTNKDSVKAPFFMTFSVADAHTRILLGHGASLPVEGNPNEIPKKGRIVKYKVGCVLLLVASLARAQSTLGNIVGSVQDPSQANVAGAVVKLRNLDDNGTRSTLSMQDGSFEFLNLKAGKYSITIERDGFSPYSLASLQLDARQTQRVEATLSIASAGATVEVNESAAVVNTENGTLADTKKFNQVVQLPMNYRGGNDSPLAALVAVPGVQQDSNGNISIGGGSPSQIQYSVDGSSTVNVRQNGALGNMNPSSELISEFKVAQFNNNAEFSQAGDVTIITKSGGNQFHGSAFEYMQNSGLDATAYGFDSKAHKAFNTFGGSLSGPVRKDKTFFFADFEANRRRFATPQQFSVPTADVRAGVLAGLPGDVATDPPHWRSISGQPDSGESSEPDGAIPVRELRAAAELQQRRGHQRQLSPAGTDAGERERLRHPHRPEPQQQAAAFRPLELEERGHHGCQRHFAQRARPRDQSQPDRLAQLHNSSDAPERVALRRDALCHPGEVSDQRRSGGGQARAQRPRPQRRSQRERVSRIQFQRRYRLHADRPRQDGRDPLADHAGGGQPLLGEGQAHDETRRRFPSRLLLRSGKLRRFRRFRPIHLQRRHIHRQCVCGPAAGTAREELYRAIRSRRACARVPDRHLRAGRMARRSQSDGELRTALAGAAALRQRDQQLDRVRYEQRRRDRARRRHDPAGLPGGHQRLSGRESEAALRAGNACQRTRTRRRRA